MITEPDKAMKNATDHQRDSLFASPLGEVGEFKFDKSVADVFPDMLKRSIPGYQAIISQSGLLAARFVQPTTQLYDLGCSLGATTLSMRHAIRQADAESEQARGCRIHAVDNSQAMLDKAAAVIDAENHIGSLPVELHCEDIQQTSIENASVVAMNFTLQFIPPAERDKLMHTISDALRPGGALILSEKVTFDDPVLNELHIEMYHNFKSANGYSDLEISQKRTALENVMIPDTLDTHAQRLKTAGFRSSSVWFQCFNFASIVAIK